MIKVTNLKEIDQIQPLMLKAYIANENDRNDAGVSSG